MEISAPPEICGASGYMKADSSSVRLSAKIHTWKQGKENLFDKRNKKKSEEEKIDGTYKIHYPL
jgi:hypothetical protein